jgi:hypothetical protein
MFLSYRRRPHDRTTKGAARWRIAWWGLLAFAVTVVSCWYLADRLGASVCGADVLFTAQTDGSLNNLDVAVRNLTAWSSLCARTF